MLFYQIVMIAAAAGSALAAPHTQYGRVVPGVIARDNGDCSFADGKSATIPNGQRGCCALGGVFPDSPNGNICECNNGVAAQVDTCPLKTVFLFVKEGETCHPAPGQNPGFTCS